MVLNYALISRFGMMGAALATFLSFLFLAIAELFFSQRVYPIKFEFKRLITISIVGGSLAYLATLVDFDLVPSLLVKAILLSAFPVLLYLFGFLEENELKKLFQVWGTVKKARFRPKLVWDSIRQEMIS